MLERNIVRQKTGQLSMQCQNKLINYNADFRLYITTCLPNPHYSPGIASKVTLLDFTLTNHGLQQKMLSTIVAEERIDLQERKEHHIVETAKNKELLYKFESNILEVLSSSEGNILEDENAINILSTSKCMSEEIQSKQLNAISTESEIDTEIEKYTIVAKHAWILYYCLMQLASINYVYQFSLNWFMDLFVESVRETPKRQQSLIDRLVELNGMFTKRIYRRTIQTLYRRDRIVFSFLIRIELMRSSNQIRNEELNFLLSNESRNNSYEKGLQEELDFDWLPKDLMRLIVKAEELAR